MFFDRTGYWGEYCEIAISSDDSPPCLLRMKWKGRSGEGGGQSPPSMIGTHSFERVLREPALLEYLLDHTAGFNGVS